MASLRPMFLQIALAMVITAVIVPMVLDEDMEEIVVLAIRGVAMGIAAFMVLLCICLTCCCGSRSPKVDPKAPAKDDASVQLALSAQSPQAIQAMSAKIHDEIRFCNLVLRQWSMWS